MYVKCREKHNIRNRHNLKLPLLQEIFPINRLMTE